ncbi:MAG: glycerol acyltransferase, partial [Fluviicola sp.]|nr:glycerol acyltransferase [Fluviicola sp.]
MAEAKLIDIEKLIASKNPKTLKWMPRFVIRYLKRILHQDEVNGFLADNKDKKGVDWCEAGVKFMKMTFSVKNIEKIPKEGKIVLVMNHPLGGMDAIILV